MNLRWGRHLGTHVSHVASLATTRESGMCSIGNLESIQESSSKDSHFDMFSEVGSEMGTNVGMNQEKIHKGKFVDNPFDDLSGEMDFKVQLTFQ